MKMGSEKSEVLVSGVSEGSGGTIPMTTEKRVGNGEYVFLKRRQYLAVSFRDMTLVSVTLNVR